VKVTDVQGFTANVKPHIAIDDNKTLHPIDKVMMPGEPACHPSCTASQWLNSHKYLRGLLHLLPCLL
jgi:hypothetical protein